MQNKQTNDQSKIEAIKINASLDECLNIPSERSASPCLFELEFRLSLEADKFFKKLQKILPFADTEYPQLSNNKVTLTNEQFYCLQINLMQESGELRWKFLSDNYLMKTLRADQHDFTHSFKLGLIPGKNGRRYNNLRPKPRSEYVMTSEGDIVARVDKKPRYTPDQKKEFSQIQSNTFLDEKLLSEAFGFSKKRNRKLYGLLTHMNDALLSRLLIRDCGTLSRPFDFSNSKDAEYSGMRQKSSSKPHCYPPSKLTEFKQHNLELRHSIRGTNEVLARIRFNPYRSLVVICSDTLETRLLAEYFARELMEEFRVYANANGLSLNPEFRIPIVYYLPTTSHLPRNLLTYRPPLRFYTEKMKLADKTTCQRLYKNPQLRAEKFSHNDYEFLLGLPEITPQILLDETTPSGRPLALEMISNFHTRMLSRLLRSINNPSDNTLAEAVFDELIKCGKIQKDDSIIAKLIEVEDFVLATLLIDKTKTDIKTLLSVSNDSSSCNAVSLTEHLQTNGNARQLKFIGLKDIVDQNALNYTWTLKKLCLKEFPSECRELLGQLLYNACGYKENKKQAEVKFLLEHSADKTVQVDGYTPIMIAADIQDWLTVSMFAQYETDPEDKACYGYALLIALKNQQKTLAESLIKAGAKALWRKSLPGFDLISTLYFAVLYDYCDLLPKLLAHEKTSAEGFYSRAFYARYFAIARNNHPAVSVLNEALSDTLTVISFENESSLRECLSDAFKLEGIKLFIFRLKEILRSSVKSKAEQKYYLSLVKNWFDSELVGTLDIEILDLIFDFEGIVIYEAFLQFIIQINDSNLDEIFSKLIDMAQEDNFIYINTIIESIFQRFGKQLCIDKLDKAFNIKFSACTYSKSVFFIKLGTAIFYDSNDNSSRTRHVLFTDIAKNEDHEVIFNLLDNPRNSKHIKDDLIYYLISGYKNYNIRSLMDHYPVEITRYLFETALFCSKEEALSYFIEVILEYPNYKINKYDPLLQLWAYRERCSSGLINKFILACGTTYIRHLSIMCMLDYMESATAFNWSELEKRFSNIFKRNIRIAPYDSPALENRHGSISPHYYVIKDHQSYLAVFTVLNNYFTNKDILPSPEVINKTFYTLLSEFRQRVNQPRALTFFKSDRTVKEFEKKMFDFLSSTEERLSAFEPNVFDLDSNLFKANEPTSVDYLDVYQIIGLY